VQSGLSYGTLLAGGRCACSPDCLMGVVTVLVFPVCRCVFMCSCCVCDLCCLCFSSPVSVGLSSTLYTGLPDL
jgi:hypothetical protein